MKHATILATFVLVAAATSFTAPVNQHDRISLKSRDWVVYYRGGASPHPTNLRGMSGWYFDFPTDPDAVGYLVNLSPPPDLTSYSAISFTAETVALSGLPIFNYRTEPENTCDFPAHARAYFVGGVSPDWGRWWSSPIAFQLDQFDTETLTTPLDPSQWSAANGLFANSSPEAEAGFRDALAHPEAVGLTFGGGCFYAHGVNVLNGTARFILTNYVVVP